MAVVSKRIGVSDQTYYHWRKEYGDMIVNQDRWLTELEQENSPFKESGSR